ncbi:MAG: acetolactate synthase small subunit [Acidobacteriota bacterium]|nr:MAG: acetolactate synthase small subunit [Acidobacteriota bacterium]
MKEPFPKEEEREYTISMLVMNRFGLVSRVSGLISRRGYNINSFIAEATMNPDIYRMVIKVNATETGVAQLTKQIAKLIDVIRVSNSLGARYLERELILVKLKVPEGECDAFVRAANLPPRASVVETKGDRTLVAFHGTPDEVQALVKTLEPFGVEDIVKSGVTAIRWE